MVTQVGNTLVIDGNLTYDEEPTIKENVIDVLKNYNSITFDLTKAGFVNSTGLSTFALAIKKAPGQVTLKNVPAGINRMLGLTRLNKLVKIINQGEEVI